MHTAYLLIGGNLGNRLQYLQKATGIIGEKAGRVSASSAVYETAAWGNTNQDAFLNQVLAVRTGLSAAALMAELLAIEAEMGRKRLEKFGPRTIDIDILFFDDEVHKSPFITIPHAEVTKRRFALVPLADLVPELLHPERQQSIAQLLAACVDPLDVKKI
jgi:2-amino-4-hydroxy-6-hydroxymethyldihydropteridine diphosphokinase